MSSFCPHCGREIVWGVSETGDRVPLDLPPVRRYWFLHPDRPLVREVETYQPHPVNCKVSKPDP